MLSLHTNRDTYVRMLFIDFTLAFTTISPLKLITKLGDLDINTSICNWRLDFPSKKSSLKGLSRITFRKPSGNFLFIFSACKKEPELITGSITGRMTIYDQFYTTISDRSGIELTLLGPESVAGTGMTETDGIYHIDDVPYGKYRIRMRKDGFVEGYNPPFIYHVGGYSPTIFNMSIFEVPKYELSLDSVSYDSDLGNIILHLKVDGDTVIQTSGWRYLFIAYAGNNPEVSANNYITLAKGCLRDYAISSNSQKIAVYSRIVYYDFSPQIKDAISGTVYLRIYPLAHGQGYGATQFYKEALGKPSNVISFRWDEIAGKH